MSRRWPPQNIDVLLDLDGASETVRISNNPYEFIAGPGKGVLAYEPKYMQPLLDDGLAELMPDLATCYRPTAKGKEAIALLKREISVSRFRQPDWLLEALTGETYTYVPTKPIPTSSALCQISGGAPPQANCSCGPCRTARDQK